MANLSCKGSKVRNSKLHESIIPTIRALLKRGVKPKEIAEMFGVSVSTISNVKRGKIWAHVK